MHRYVREVRAFDATLDPLGELVDLIDSGATMDRGALVSNASGFAVTWALQIDGDDAPAVYFHRFGADGTPLGEWVLVTDEGHTGTWTTLVWTGRGYGVTWKEIDPVTDSSGRLAFAHLDADGRPRGASLGIVERPNSGRSASLVWTGEDFGLTYKISRPIAGGGIESARESALMFAEGPFGCPPPAE